MESLKATIEAERTQAEGYSLRAEMFEDIGLCAVANVFRELVQLCDLKVQALQKLDLDRCKQTMTLRPRRKSDQTAA